MPNIELHRWGIARDNLRGQKSLGPLKMSLKMAHKVIVPQKKNMSRSFLNSGTLIVNISFVDASNSMGVLPATACTDAATV
jgi:hypothetical protein